MQYKLSWLNQYQAEKPIARVEQIVLQLELNAAPQVHCHEQTQERVRFSSEC